MPFEIDVPGSIVSVLAVSKTGLKLLKATY
jgi:hypothetical protein